MSSFVGWTNETTDEDRKLAMNSIFEGQLDHLSQINEEGYQDGFVELPLLFLDNIVYQGQWQASALADAFCEFTSNNQDQMCKQREKCFNCGSSNRNSLLWGILGIATVIFFVVALGVFRVYQRRHNIQSHNDELVKDEISKMVSKYKKNQENQTELLSF